MILIFLTWDNPHWRGKRSRHSRRMRNPQFTYLARGPWAKTFPTIHFWLPLHLPVTEQYSHVLNKSLAGIWDAITPMWSRFDGWKPSCFHKKWIDVRSFKCYIPVSNAIIPRMNLKLWRIGEPPLCLHELDDSDDIFHMQIDLYKQLDHLCRQTTVLPCIAITWAVLGPIKDVWIKIYFIQTHLKVILNNKIKFYSIMHRDHSAQYASYVAYINWMSHTYF